MRKNQKGFTLVELLVVIAILAILATVAVVGYSSFIESAKESNDKTLVGQMNTFLQANEMLDYNTIVDLYEGLGENGITADDYQTRVEGRFFFWDKKLNRVLYTDEEYNVIFPTEYKDVKHTDHQWYSLSGAINEEKVEIAEDGKVTIDTAEQLYYFSNHLKDVVGDKTTITVSISGNIDLMGADVALDFTFGDKNQNDKRTVVVEGATDGSTITGLVQIKSKMIGTKGDGVGKEYACGFIAKALNANLTVKNIKIVDSVVGDLEVGSVAALVGRVEYGTLNINNCQVLNSTVNGKNKVGALLGMSNSDVTIIGSEVKNVTVNCSEGESGIAIGCVFQKSTVTIDKAFSEWVTNSTLSLVESSGRKTEAVENKNYLLVEKLEDDLVTRQGYRFHLDGAYMTTHYTEGTTVSVNGNDEPGTKTDLNKDKTTDLAFYK